MSILQPYDPFREAVINPSDFIKPVKNFPKAVVSTFPRQIVEKFVKHMGAEEIACTFSANGKIPVYALQYGGQRIAFYMSPVGAPAAAAIMEEIIAMGGERFVFFGSCGVLQRDIAAGHFVVPTAALRDEGTSFHYLPPEEEIALNPAGVKAITETLAALGFPYVQSKTWTTDAIYRETRDKVRARKKAGCSVVEMECAALAAVAEFRGVEFAQFLFADDNLDAPSWEPRTMGENGMTHSDKYMAAALECVLRMG